jgi:hypothetical protein
MTMQPALAMPLRLPGAGQMSSAEIIALVCILCLVPLWAAGSIIMFALGTIRCGRLMDPYYDGGGSGGERDRCPMNPQPPRDDRGVEEPNEPRPGRDEAAWWPQFERELGRYVKEHESLPSGRGATPTEAQSAASGVSGTRTPA